MGDVENMLERDKGRKVDEAESLLNDLDDQIDDLAQKRDDLYKKLGEYKNLIADAKSKEGREDPELLAKLRDLDAEAKALEREIGDVDAKMMKDVQGKLTRIRTLINAERSGKKVSFNPLAAIPRSCASCRHFVVEHDGHDGPTQPSCRCPTCRPVGRLLFLIRLIVLIRPANPLYPS